MNEPNSTHLAIQESMELLAYFYNPSFDAGRNKSFQFTFCRPDENIDYQLEVSEGKCSAAPGKAANPVWWVETDLETWQQISGGYTSGAKAMREKKLRFKKGMLKFLFRFPKEFGGCTRLADAKGAYSTSVPPSQIKRVLVLSCSGRANMGATDLLVSRIAEGMKEAGATVEFLYPAKMNITPCKGCFSCALSQGKCIFDDDMKIYFEKSRQADLLFFASPVYVYHGTAHLKLLMDRFFQNAHHSITTRAGKELHPRRNNHFPYIGLLGVAGFSYMELFDPLAATFNLFSKSTGMPLIGMVRRPSAMSFLLDNVKIKAKDDVLEAMVRAGFEMVANKQVSKQTLKKAEQPLMPKPRLISAGNFYLDRAVKTGDFSLFKRS